MSGPTTTNEPTSETVTPAPPPTPASDPTTDPAGDSSPMTPATRQFAIRAAVVTLCLVLGVIVVTQAILVLVLHDGPATANVVNHLTNMGYGIVGALIVIVGGPHILASIIAAVKGSTGV